MTAAFERKLVSEAQLHKEWQAEIDRRDDIIYSDKQVIFDLNEETARLDERLAHCEAENEAYRFALEKIANLAPVLMPRQLVDRFIEVRVLAGQALDGSRKYHAGEGVSEPAPMKLHFTNEWLNAQIEQDGYEEP